MLSSTNVPKENGFPKNDAPIPQRSGEGSEKDVEPLNRSVKQPPVLSTRTRSSHPLKTQPDTIKTDDGHSRQSWVEMIPWDVRFLVLKELTKQPAFEAVQADLVSYACTSKAASNDVKDFHHIWREPCASLLASRKLVQCAWDAAKAQGWFGHEKAFMSAIKSAASAFSAVILDAREGAAYGACVPSAISALLESNVEHLHFRLGYSSMEPDCGAQLQGIQALITASMERLKKGKSLPTVFLSMQGIPVREIAAALKASPIHLNVIGFSLCSYADNFKMDVFEDKSGRRFTRTGICETAEFADWNALFSQLKNIRYLDLNGWSGEGLSAALDTWFHQFRQLEEFHIPLCEVNQPCFVQLSNTIEKKSTFKCLGLDYVHITPVRGFVGRADLVSALKNNPAMRIIRPTQHPVLKDWTEMEPFWRKGRYLISAVPNAIRALPEIYGQVDFFKPATS